MRTVTLILFLARLSAAYNTTADCVSCFRNSSNVYCKDYPTATSGYCCDRSLGSEDACNNGTHYCSDLTANAGLKYGFCPVLTNKCSGTYQVALRSDVVETLNTAMDYGKDDVCSWELVAQTDYTFNKKIKLQFSNVFAAQCWLNTGDTISGSDTTEISCASGTQHEIDSNKRIWVTVLGSSSPAYIQYTATLVENVELVWVGGYFTIAVGGLVIFSVLFITIALCFMVRRTIVANRKGWEKVSWEYHQQEKRDAAERDRNRGRDDGYGRGGRDDGYGRGPPPRDDGYGRGPPPRDDGYGGGRGGGGGGRSRGYDDGYGRGDRY